MPGYENCQFDNIFIIIPAYTNIQTVLLFLIPIAKSLSYVFWYKLSSPNLCQNQYIDYLNSLFEHLVSGHKKFIVGTTPIRETRMCAFRLFSACVLGCFVGGKNKTLKFFALPRMAGLC